MKYLLQVVAAACLVFHQSPASQRSDSDPRRISVEELRTSIVVGELGVELGTCTNIQATIVAGDRSSKGGNRRYFLDVTHIEGKALSIPVRMDFRIHRFSNGEVQLANNPSSLYELLHGQKAPEIDDKMKEALEKNYLGSQVCLNVFETAVFDGVPRNIPEDFVLWQDMDYYLQTKLVVMTQGN